MKKMLTLTLALALTAICPVFAEYTETDTDKELEALMAELNSSIEDEKPAQDEKTPDISTSDVSTSEAPALPEE
jgi:uncharacterized protein YxeA